MDSLDLHKTGESKVRICSHKETPHPYNKRRFMFEKVDHLLFYKLQLEHIPLFNFSLSANAVMV